jgi:Tol biopolymer transport system component
MSRRSLLAALCSALAVSAGAQTSTPPLVNGGSPLVSPSGPRILFESNRTGRNQLWIVSADGIGERQLTNRDLDVSGGQWAPDGKSIFYSVMIRDTSWLYELWPDSSPSRERMLGAFPGRVPQLSPTRDMVVYDVGPWTASHLVLSDAKGRAPRQVTDDSLTVWRGVWSPNGRELAYTVSKKSGMSLWVMNEDGSNPHQVTHLTPEEGRAQVPAWHPDSHQLAFQANASSPKANPRCGLSICKPLAPAKSFRTLPRIWTRRRAGFPTVSDSRSRAIAAEGWKSGPSISTARDCSS